MKLIKIISLASSLLLFSMNLYSQDKLFSIDLYSKDTNSSVKSRLLIHNFSTTDNYENIKKKEKNYQYYSIVIPEAISKTLNKSGNFQIRRDKEYLSLETEFKDRKEKAEYTNNLKELGLQSKSDYIITGTFNVIDKKLAIRIIIFDVAGKEIDVINHESDELGVQLQETTDLVSQLVAENIEKLSRINQDKTNRSPFLTLYAPFSIITMGIDAGYLYFLGNWRSLYNNSLYLTPFIDLDLSEDFKLSLKFTSIQSDTEDKDTTAYSQIRILSSSLSICYLYRFNSNFGVALSAGGGMTKTTITIEPDKPFSDPMSEKISADPNIDIASYLSFNSPSFTFRTGVSYKRIFFKDRPMDSAAIFAGAGIHF